MNLRRDHDRLARGRQRRIVCDVVNCRANIRDELAVEQSRRAEIVRQGHGRRRFEPVAVQAQQRFRPAAQPARFEPQRGGLSRSERVRVQRHFARVSTRPQATAATDMQRATADVASVLQTRTHHDALKCPAVRAALECGIGNVICAVVTHFNVIHETLARIKQTDLRVTNRRIVVRTVIENGGSFDVCPNRFLRLIAVRPIRRESVVTLGINQLQTAAAARRPLAPTSARAVGQIIHHDVDDVGHNRAVSGRGVVFRWHGQCKILTIVRQLTAEISDSVRCV